MNSNNNIPLVEETNQWAIIHVSEVTPRNINALIKNLKLPLSENFYISFNSLIKLGKKARKNLQFEIKNIVKSDWRKYLFEILLENASERPHNLYPLVSHLYYPDFVKRAQAINVASENNLGADYFDIILPLLDDPDDSVRWAALNYLISKDKVNMMIVQGKLNERREMEQNKTILCKIDSLID
ncbi:MAG: hypothetical protein ACFFAS_01110 [Promethearchaeota archaeon]